MVRPRDPPVSALITVIRDLERCSRTAASLRCPTSSEDFDTANMLAPPTRTASSPVRRAPSLTTRSINSGTARSANFQLRGGALPPDAGSTTWANPATLVRRSSSARPMHEPSPRDTRTSPATAEAASSPILTIVSAMDLEAEAPQHELDPTGVGDEQERHGAVLAFDHEVGIEQQGGIARTGALRQHGL